MSKEPRASRQQRSSKQHRRSHHSLGECVYVYATACPPAFPSALMAACIG
jgi:hypothetical protein